MAGMQRKDYGSDAVVSPSDEAVKRINNINNPFSVEQIGLDKSKEKYVPVESAVLDSLVSAANTLSKNVQVLLGNRKAYIKSITSGGVNPNFTLATATIAYKDEKTGDEVIFDTLTKAQMLAHPKLFLAVES